jgi:hypothetical protein
MLKLGLGAAVTLAVLGGGVALLRPGLVDGRLGEASRALMRAVARAVLDGSLPREGERANAALDAHLERLQITIAGFPPATRDELSRLLAVLSTAPGRVALTGLRGDWPQASVADVQGALQTMRVSSMTARRQIYQALRDLTNAAYYADPSTWPLLGYPGTRVLA